MKSIIKRRAKSALAILLTLCMVMSVFTIGVVSASAATDNSEGVGASDLGTVWFDNSVTKWTNVYCFVGKSDYVRAYKMDAIAGNSTIFSKNIGGFTDRTALFFASAASTTMTGGSTSHNITDTKTTLTSGSYTANISQGSDNGSLFYVKSATNGSTLYRQENKFVLASGTSEGSSGLATASWSSTSDVMNYNGSSYSITYKDVNVGSYAVAVVKYNDWNTSYKYSAAGTGTNCTLSDNGGNDHNLKITTTAKSDITITLTSSNKINVTATLKKIAAPTNVKINGAATSTVNASGNSTLTWTAVSGAKSYEIYKESTKVGTSNTNSYPISNTTANAGTYTVKAVPTDSSYLTSDASTSSATLTVYEPTYCLVGNVDDSTIIKGGSVITPTAPSGSNSYWNTWQDQLIVDETTATPGVYRITVKINEDGRRDTANIGLGIKGSGTAATQKAFRLGSTNYNTSGSDLTITDAGIADGDNLYVNNLGTPAGGSIVLKKGQTYTITIDQTKRYNNSSSYPWGKITITTTDAFVDAFAKMQSFNATDGEYEDITDASAAVGTASASPVHGSKDGFNSTLTAATVNNNYTFQGWYSDAACTNRVYTNATQSLTNVTESAKYYALFKQNTPSSHTVTTDTSYFGNISITGGVKNGSAYQGATVSIKATVTDNSKEFSRWSILTDTANPVDITSTVCANPTQAQTTLTMPAQNIKIVAYYVSRTPLNITVSSNNNELGTASYTAGTYYVGDEVTIEATNAGGVFSRWVVTGGTIDNATSATAHITSNGATVTARAVFDYKTYQLYYGDKLYTMLRMNDGKYISTSKVDSSAQFTVYDASSKLYARSSSNPYGLHTNGTAWTSGAVASWNSTAGNKYSISNNDNGSYYVHYDPSNGTYGTVTIYSDNPLGDIAAVYAKDGTIRYKANNVSTGDLWDDGGDVTCKKGVTTVTQINGTAVPNPDSTRYDNHCRIYSAPMGSTITIETQVNDTYKDQGFYVGMFVINGWKVAASDMGNGKYTATYTLSDEYDVVNLSDHGSQKSFEITPVYYNKNFKYVTFYVDADSVPTKWNGTISTCADYRSTDGTSAGSSHFEGSYPGQPLGREGDLYEIKVAKYYYDSYNSTTKTWTEHTNYFPSATITAYNYDQVHHYYYVNKSDDLNGSTTNNNYQTYDYADFSYLAQIKDIEAIMFRCKYETSKSSWQIYGKGDDSANYDPNSTEPTWYNVSTNTDLNTWQWLTDYYGNPIDAFGNRIVKSGSGDSAVYYTAEDLASLSPTSNEQVRIVSYGNKMSTGTSTVRTKAQWATGWVVYTKGSTNGTKYFKAYGTPADFICTTPGDTSTANVKYYSDGKESDIKGKLTIISYDKERTNKISNVGDTGKRIDGQWYYSAQHDFDSTVQVHITTDSGTAVTKAHTSADADSSAAGTNDGWEGTTSKSVATLDGKTTETYHNVTTEAQLNATVGAGYTFVGWYIYDGTTYTKIHDNFVDQNTTMTMKKNYTIVAVVRKVGAGDLVITHSRYTGTNPEAHDGTGKYYVSAVVNKGQANERTIAEAQNSITVSQLKATDKLTITIRTVCNGADTFYAWYEEALGENYGRTGNYYEICSEDVDPIGEKEVSYTFFEADCSTFFNGNTLARNTIDLYSDIVHVSAYAKLTYKYYDRFAQNGKGQMVSYVVKDVPLDDTEIDNGYIPSDAKIAAYAPKVVDTIYTDTKWSIVGTKVERAASNVTLMATQTAKTCYVQYLPNDVVGNYLLKSTDEETGVRDVTAWNTRIVDFNTWLINDDANLDAPDESDFYVSAPTTYTYQDTTWNFDRFDIYEFDRLTGNIGDVIYSTNDNVFGYRIYADCVIYPVYTKGSVSKELTAKIEPAVLNREVYGDSTSPVDRLYADLIISFINIAAATGGNVPEVINENDNTEYTIETGVILDKSVNLNDTDYNTIKHAAETGQTDTTSSIISGYTGFTDENVVKTFAQTAVADSKTRQAKSGNLTKYVNNNSDLTNKNRLDKVFRYTNSTDAQKRIFAAYSYVLIKKNGVQVAFAISGVQKFNFCYTGNKPLSTLS